MTHKKGQYLAAAGWKALCRSNCVNDDVQKVPKRGIIEPEADHAWFVESAAHDTSLIEHLAKRRCASK